MNVSDTALTCIQSLCDGVTHPRNPFLPPHHQSKMRGDCDEFFILQYGKAQVTLHIKFLIEQPHSLLLGIGIRDKRLKLLHFKKVCIDP